MRKTSDQQGFGAIATVLVLVIVGIIGFTGWYVFNAKNNSDDTQKQTDRAANSSDGSHSGRRSRILDYDKVPAELQTAILATAKADTPNCVKGDAYVDSSGKTRTAPNVQYMASKGFALTSLGCDGIKDNIVIFAKQQDNSWKKAAATVDNKAEFKCSELTASKVPSSFLRTTLENTNAGTREVRCLTDDLNAPDVVYEESKS